MHGFVQDAEHISREYIEIESGKNNNRTQLTAAIEDANRTGSVLLIAKLDRLSRNAGFIFQLKDSGVQFVCADMPDANTLTVGIFATIAQHERETIAKRTKDALAAKKARGEQLGNICNLMLAGRQKAREVMQHNARVAKENVQAIQLIELLLGQKNNKTDSKYFEPKRLLHKAQMRFYIGNNITIIKIFH